jgi:hypothetical protein
MKKGEDGQFYCLGCDYVNHSKNTVKGRFCSIQGLVDLF